MNHKQVCKFTHVLVIHEYHISSFCRLGTCTLIAHLLLCIVCSYIIMQGCACTMNFIYLLPARVVAEVHCNPLLMVFAILPVFEGSTAGRSSSAEVWSWILLNNLKHMYVFSSANIADIFCSKSSFLNTLPCSNYCRSPPVCLIKQTQFNHPSWDLFYLLFSWSNIGSRTDGFLKNTCNPGSDGIDCMTINLLFPGYWYYIQGYIYIYKVSNFSVKYF